MNIFEIAEFIDEKEIVELVEDLVEIPSHPGVKDQETAVAEYIYDKLLKENIESQIIKVTDDRCNVIAKISGSGNGRTLLLTGHTDTVETYDMQNPFQLINEHGKLRGRGAVDMKGQLACMIMTLITIKRLNIKLDGDLYFCGVIDEECKSEGTIALLDSGIRFDAAIVGEPTNFDVCTAHRGLEWFEVIFEGKAVHGGRQDEGINAINKCNDFINVLENDLIPILKNRIHPVTGHSTMNYGFIHGGTQPSTVAGNCILKFDRRWIPGEKYDDVVNEYKSIINNLKKRDPSFSAELKVMDSSLMKEGYVHESMETGNDNFLVKSVLKNVETVLHKKGNIACFPAWSDGGLLSSYGKIPTIVFGPGDMTSAHSKDEYIEKSQLVPAVLIYLSTALDVCNSSGI